MNAHRTFRANVLASLGEAASVASTVQAYFMRRVFSSMRNILSNEIIADYFGIVAARAGFQHDWLLRFMGLEAFPSYRVGGRLENFRSDRLCPTALSWFYSASGSAAPKIWNDSTSSTM